MIFITTCTVLYHCSGFFIIMSPAEGLHFSALVIFSDGINFCEHSLTVFRGKVVIHVTNINLRIVAHAVNILIF